jgi:quercetin dioxygenase-like cupin family protein
MNTQIKIIYIVGFLVLSCHQDNPKKTEFTTLLETTKSWDGDTLPKYPEGQPNITILKAVIPGHSKLCFHKHTVINAAVVLDGELTVVTDVNDTLYVKAGDAFSEVVNSWHYGVNDSAKPAELIIFYAGIVGGTNTIIKK